MEQAAADDQPAVHIAEEENGDGEMGTVLKISFACSSPVSWPAMSGSMDGFLISCRKIQMFEKKGVSLGVVVLVVQSGSERQFKARVEAAIRSAIKRPRNGGGVKLPFGLCGCQEENSRGVEDDGGLFDGGDGLRSDHVQLPSSLPESVVVVAVDEWGTVRSGCGGSEISRWMINSDEVEIVDRMGTNSFKGVYRGKKVWIKKMRGCERGSAYEFEIRQDLLQLMTCGQRNILQFVGMCIDESNGLCIVTRMMDGGSVHDLIQRNKKMGAKEVMRIALDVAEGLMFMNSHGVAYRDLNAQRILLDRQGNAFLGDMGILPSCNNAGEVTEYETAGYRWLAPEVSNVWIPYTILCSSDMLLFIKKLGEIALYRIDN